MSTENTAAVASASVRRFVIGLARDPATCASSSHPSPIIAQVLGSSRRGAWLAVPRPGGSIDVLVVTARGGARLPNGIELVTPTMPGLESGDRVTLGDGGLEFAGHRVVISRWWNPRPVLAAIDPRGLALALDGEDDLLCLRSEVPAAAVEAVAAALHSHDVTDLVRAAGAVLGRGPGLTPECDDFLSGVIAAHHLLGQACDDHGAMSLIADARAPLMALAGRQTTALSAALLDHAFAGEVPHAAGEVLRALARCASSSRRRGDGARSPVSSPSGDLPLRALTGLGHSSGRAWAHGIAVAARALVRVPEMPVPARTTTSELQL